MKPPAFVAVTTSATFLRGAGSPLTCISGIREILIGPTNFALELFDDPRGTVDKISSRVSSREGLPKGMLPGFRAEEKKLPLGNDLIKKGEVGPVAFQGQL